MSVWYLSPSPPFPLYLCTDGHPVPNVSLCWTHVKQDSFCQGRCTANQGSLCHQHDYWSHHDVLLYVLDLDLTMWWYHNALGSSFFEKLVCPTPTLALSQHKHLTTSKPVMGSEWWKTMWDQLMLLSLSGEMHRCDQVHWEPHSNVHQSNVQVIIHYTHIENTSQLGNQQIKATGKREQRAPPIWP